MSVRQAVIIIHGMGEQRPMDTLRSFVKAVVNKPIRNKPDPMSRLFELRRLQAPSDRETPLTDFYEYYWAYRMRDTGPKMLLRWFRSLLFRSPWNIPVKLRPFYYLSWTVVLVTLFTVLHLGLKTPTAGSVAAFVVAAISNYIIAFVYGYLGDAARYFDPHPDNIEQRNKIREEGIALLHALHESKKYNRIVVVGHSLGSVIGYDLLRLYWSSVMAPKPDNPVRVSMLRSFEEERDHIFNAESVSAAEAVEKYQQLQFKLWRELRETNMWPWLVTDFVTMGSPLTHAKLLLARSDTDFDVRKQEGELVTCPPANSKDDIWYSRQYQTDNGPRNADTPTHMIPFACTRWTNIYFPHHHAIYGDMIGGALRENFGAGIRDVEVGLKGRCSTLISHVCYWKGSKQDAVEGVRHPIAALKLALKLDCLRGGVKLPPQ